MTSLLKVDTRSALLEAGKNIMFEKGYSNTGIQEVLNSVGVPKGSFYHHFNSKEDFAVKIIEYANEKCSVESIEALQNKEVSAKTRLINYCQKGKAALTESQCRKGCFIGNLSQEMADQSEALRQTLSAIMNQWKMLIAQCIEEGQKLGEISQAWPAEQMAELFFSAWEGSIMRAKTIKSVQPLEDFIELMFNHILIAQ